MSKFLELNFVQGEKVCISPLGDVTGVDGRFYKINSNTVLSAIRTHIPLFVNHDDYREAAGWFNKDTLEARADGIYASLELTPLGQTLVTNKSYRYLSPTYYVDDQRNVTEIESVGLVNLPNLLFKELNKKGVGTMSQQATTMTSVTTDGTKEDNAAQELAAIKAENARLAHENKTHSISAKIAAGELFEPQRDLALTLDDNAIAQLVLSNQKLALSGGRLPALKAPDGKVELNEAQKRTCVQLGISEAEFQAQIEV